MAEIETGTTATGTIVAVVIRTVEIVKGMMPAVLIPMAFIETGLDSMKKVLTLSVSTCRDMTIKVTTVGALIAKGLTVLVLM